MTIAEVAQVEYVAMQIRLDRQARSTPDTMPLTRRQMRNYARIAWRAARAEITDPDPEVKPCHICRGVKRCDKAAHELVGWPR